MSMRLTPQLAGTFQDAPDFFGILVFAAGRYVPGSESRSRLMAHELAHVVQQTASPQGVQRQPAGQAAARTRAS